MTAARHNPFATCRVLEEIPFDPAWCDTSWPELFEKLARQRNRGLIAGPHGSGKTTLLDTLERHFEGMKVVRWLLTDQQNRPHWKTLETGGEPSILLIDGSERLSPLAWLGVLRKTRTWSGLIATDHRVRRLQPGRPPLLIETRTRPEMLSHFVSRLAPGGRFSERDLSAIFLKSRGNLREALWHCYDRVARESAPGPPHSIPGVP